MEILKQKNTIAETKNSVDNLNSKTEIIIKKSMSLNLLIHIIQSEKQRKKIEQRDEQSLMDLRDNVKRSNIQVLGRFKRQRMIPNKQNKC